MKYIIFFSLYLIAALLYIINTGIDVPSQIDQQFRKNPPSVYFILAVIYTLIGFMYLEESIRKTENIIFFRGIQISVTLLLFYVGLKILNNKSGKKINKKDNLQQH